ncbi:hypothetical protein PT974_11949 [Cladobotryum mycophilum]|uniref:Nuclear membrane fusion protein Kar5 n=1 Tax=Cladobotryum mycophilum TaxID=491253 RepID=A0ABR0S7R2_9HYPO
MARVLLPTLLLWSFSVALNLFAFSAHAFSWGGVRQAQKVEVSMEPPRSRHSHAYTSSPESRLPNMYMIALSELQELESEPLCHRIAARLLVNNCQILDGQNDATVLMDTGRAARDFVDSYAASLAICDLERGSFRIPSACSKFRESTLASVSPPSKPQLHVTTAEIDGCLEGLAQSDSAWNTWVSYRHKALRFCEAARADNEKDQNIRLHQRITNILSRLTTQLEKEMDGHFQSLNRMFRDASMAAENLKPQLYHISDGLAEIESILRTFLIPNAQQSADSITTAREEAKTLEELLAMLVRTVHAQNSEMVQSHETSLRVSTEKVSNEIGVVMTSLAAVLMSSTSLQKEIENSQLRAAEVAFRQERIEMGMKRLEGMADTLSIQQEGHQERLDHAQQSATELLGILDSASSSAATLQSSIYSGFGWTAWWPYVFCPITSLVVGSYGLPPSTTRNFLLIGLGEIAGLAMSVANQYGAKFGAEVTIHNKEDAKFNKTVTFHDTIYPNSDLPLDGHFQQIKFSKNVY